MTNAATNSGDSTSKKPKQADLAALLKELGYQFSTCAGEFESYHNWFNVLFSVIRHEAMSGRPEANLLVDGLASIGTFLIETSNQNVAGYAENSERLWGQVTANAKERQHSIMEAAL